MIGYDTLWTMVLSDIFLRRCENYHSTPILIFNFIMIFIFIIINFFLVLIILIILIFMFMLNFVFIPFLIIFIIFIPNICLQWHSFYTGPTAEPSGSVLRFVSRSVMLFTISSLFIIQLPMNMSLLFPNCFNLFLSASTFSYLPLLFPFPQVPLSRSVHSLINLIWVRESGSRY